MPVAAWSPPPPSPVRRTPLPRIVAIGGGLLAGSVLVLALWAILLRGGDGSPRGQERQAEKPESVTAVLEPVPEGATDPATGLPLRPHVRLDHPSGARADVPGGAALYGDAMDLRRIELPADRTWDHGGSGWMFTSEAGIPVEGAVLELPAGPDGAQLIARTPLGLWTELPAERITLANGKAGVRFTVSNVPAPWVFALATPKADAPPLTAEEQADLRVEQLYWTDRGAWERETLAWLKSDAFARRWDGDAWVSLRPALETPSEQYDRLRAQVRFTLKLFTAARAGLTGDIAAAAGSMPLPGMQLTADGLWGAGVERLAAVKDNWVTFRSSLGDISQQSADFQVAIYVVDQWIETAMYDYTPWGIDLVKSLLDGGGLKGFDIRVLKPYGELKWTDVTIAAGAMPAIDGAVADVIGAEQKAPFAGTPALQRTLRFYGVRAMERLKVIDWIKENVDWIVRWLPVALAAGGLIPGAVGLSFAFALADQFVNWLQDWYAKGDTSPYAYMAFEGLSAGGLGGTSFLMDMVEERTLMTAEARPMLPSHGLTIAQFAYSLGMFSAVRGTDWYVFKTIRAVNAGTRGYCAWGRCDDIAGAIPPVMMHVRAAGLLRQDEGAYPANVDRLMAYRLEYGGSDFHKDWLEGHRTANGALADLPFNEYGRSGWPVVVQETVPEHQVLRLEIPKGSIPPEVWGDRPKTAPLSDFGAEVTLTAPNGNTVKLPLNEPAEKLATDTDDMFYAAVRVRDANAKPVATAAAYTYEKGFDAPASQEGSMSGSGRLQAKVAGTVTFQDPRAKPLAFEVDFTALPLRRALVISMDPSREYTNDEWVRVQYAPVSMQLDLFGVYRLTKWQFQGGSPEMTTTYNDGFLYYFGRNCETNPGACKFELYDMTRFGGGLRAQICGPSRSSGTGCSSLADSRPWKEQDPEMHATALAPLAHDNYLTIAGPVMTGSDDVGAAWDTGTPAIIYHWNEVRAEFKDGRVTGVVTTGQFHWDVVNGQRVNERTLLVTYTFEGVKQK